MTDLGEILEVCGDSMSHPIIGTCWDDKCPLGEPKVVERLMFVCVTCVYVWIFRCESLFTSDKQTYVPVLTFVCLFTFHSLAASTN